MTLSVAAPAKDDTGVHLFSLLSPANQNPRGLSAAATEQRPLTERSFTARTQANGRMEQLAAEGWTVVGIDDENGRRGRVLPRHQLIVSFE
jgi:hypothetical protein